jgi:hypothetical protein
MAAIVRVPTSVQRQQPPAVMNSQPIRKSACFMAAFAFSSIMPPFACRRPNYFIPETFQSVASRSDSAPAGIAAEKDLTLR